ncbi:MAG: ATP-dependent Clp protease ATP-binding subunit ClpX [Christensenellaceae bacterium]|jgi:ATP-dependent Clp protease ATP-binding subunit ClpX|nr:ATP-dependent Clp protease ATP-binding subunit ClpX [Christensenellaceae bacterium]
MQKNNEKIELECSFCGRSTLEIGQLVTGEYANACICKRCARRALTVLDIQKKERAKTIPIHDEPKDLRPIDIRKKLDEFIIGQDSAKRKLSVAVYNHYKRINASSETYANVILEKSNILLLGPTGTGKTLLAKTLATILDVPFAISDATALTEAGYVGEDVENILSKLLQAANGDIKKAEKGIIYIDEIDKICRRSGGSSSGRDVSGEGVQQALLKIIEGTISNVQTGGNRRTGHAEFSQMDTTNILFICGGAFVGLDEFVSKRITNVGIGFNSKLSTDNENLSFSKLMDDIYPDDLIKFGLIPEFVGRLPVIAALDALDEDALSRILVEPKNSLVSQFKSLFDIDKIDLTFTDDAIHALAKKAIELKTGARGLRAILEKAIFYLMYEVPSDKSISDVIIDANFINGLSSAEIIRRPEEDNTLINIKSSRATSRKKVPEQQIVLGDEALS